MNRNGAKEGLYSLWARRGGSQIVGAIIWIPAESQLIRATSPTIRRELWSGLSDSNVRHTKRILRGWCALPVSKVEAVTGVCILSRCFVCGNECVCAYAGNLLG